MVSTHQKDNWRTVNWVRVAQGSLMHSWHGDYQSGLTLLKSYCIYGLTAEKVYAVYDKRVRTHSASQFAAHEAVLLQTGLSAHADWEH